MIVSDIKKHRDELDQLAESHAIVVLGFVMVRDTIEYWEEGCYCWSWGLGENNGFGHNSFASTNAKSEYVDQEPSRGLGLDLGEAELSLQTNC